MCMGKKIELKTKKLGLEEFEGDRAGKTNS